MDFKFQPKDHVTWADKELAEPLFEIVEQCYCANVKDTSQLAQFLPFGPVPNSQSPGAYYKVKLLDSGEESTFWESDLELVKPHKNHRSIFEDFKPTKED